MWKLYKYNKERKEQEIIDSNFDEFQQDCWGDDLYTEMEERGYIENIDNYEVDGDETGIAVMAINPEDDDFYFAWEDEEEDFRFTLEKIT